MPIDHSLSEIQLMRMPQLAEAQDLNEDWTGVKDRNTRKKLQNRLNVRAHRRRKATTSQPPIKSTPALNRSGAEPQQACWDEDQQTVSVVPARVVSSVNATKTLLPFTSPGSAPPAASIIFPLAPDHLITLIQYNVLRASMTNLRLLSGLHTVPRECSFALRIAPAPTFVFPNPEFPIPPSLCPTPLQRTVPHDKWINVIPHPRWRDNIISAGEADACDWHEMRLDILGGLWEGIPDENRGLIAWSTPWDISGWEVSEGFLRKWGWSLKGCPEVIDATNRWRMLRTEDPFVIEL